jgi:phosphate starvation-inducible PhoH-like protein
VSRGNQLAISGPAPQVTLARAALTALYQRLKGGLIVDRGEVDAMLRHARSEEAGEPGLFGNGGDGSAIRTQRRHITPRSPMQAAYLKAMRDQDLVFGLGPAGTGKTYLAVAVAVAMLTKGTVDRIVLSRPAVEAGERLGFLPGDLREKVDPYLRPLYDALHDMMPADQVVRRLASGEIEVAPLAFMRGRTLANAFVILDEAQNTTPVQMKMFLTRLGENARMVVTGDLSQVDLPKGVPSGLHDAIDTLAQVDGIGFVRFTDADVVRHALVSRIVRAYAAQDAARQTARQDPAGADLPAASRPDR